MERTNWTDIEFILQGLSEYPRAEKPFCGVFVDVPGDSPGEQHFDHPHPPGFPPSHPYVLLPL